MANPLKKPGRKPVYIHKCNQEEKLTSLIASTHDLSVIISGNGEPEKGLAFIAKANVKAIDSINSSMGKMEGKLDDALKVIHTIEIFKAEVLTSTGSKDKNFSKNTKIASIVIAVIMCLFAYYTLITKSTDNGNKIEAVQDTIRREIRLQEGVSKATRGIDGETWVKYNNQGISDSVKLPKLR
jgi:uncharacterized protein YuzE